MAIRPARLKGDNPSPLTPHPWNPPGKSVDYPLAVRAEMAGLATNETGHPLFRRVAQGKRQTPRELIPRTLHGRFQVRCPS